MNVRKRQILVTPNGTRRECAWLDVGSRCSVEVTSEEKNYPVELAFVSGESLGWRAAAPGVKRFGWFSISHKGSVYIACV